ncbi:hypothetical protein EGR_10862 [Echinococcus granulosus]|uniref:Uncharacterized protein n=1 Tax=Echinococcus granulosus TaxID=6210 RepID=W6TZV1_ECHGR|nr:hypothetical protein EGR_10862 [Echinococcus granulosus]EUB54278.1 hypothetical protein EGR_10862 [Echinococcus granulosus]
MPQPSPKARRQYDANLWHSLKASYVNNLHQTIHWSPTLHTFSSSLSFFHSFPVLQKFPFRWNFKSLCKFGDGLFYLILDSFKTQITQIDQKRFCPPSNNSTSVCWRKGQICFKLLHCPARALVLIMEKSFLRKMFQRFEIVLLEG